MTNTIEPVISPPLSCLIAPIRHGLIMAIIAMMAGALWAAYFATHHEQLHSAFEAQEMQLQQSHAPEQTNDMSMNNMDLGHGHAPDTPANHHQPAAHDAHASGDQHSHSGSLPTDAMQRLLRGHIHFMGLGVLVAVLLLVTAFTSLKPGWKKVLGWTFGVGALAYPPAWIIMGFRTVEMGPQTAEASIMWLFGPAVGLLLASMISLLLVLLIEYFGLQHKALFRSFYAT